MSGWRLICGIASEFHPKRSQSSMNVMKNGTITCARTTQTVFLIC
jgi:hypothetical protein